MIERAEAGRGRSFQSRRRIINEGLFLAERHLTAAQVRRWKATSEAERVAARAEEVIHKRSIDVLHGAAKRLMAEMR